jgi:hypothetical protein
MLLNFETYLEVLNCVAVENCLLCNFRVFFPSQKDILDLIQLHFKAILEFKDWGTLFTPHPVWRRILEDLNFSFENCIIKACILGKYFIVPADAAAQN